MQKTDIIPFNSLVHDDITGFEGYVIFRVEHLNNCTRYSIQPLSKDGQLSDPLMFNGQSLRVIKPPKRGLRPAVKTPDNFELGVKLKDRLTGIAGIAVLRVKHRYAGDQYGIQAPMNKKTGEIPGVVTFDEDDLEQIDPPVPKVKKKKEDKPPSGPHGYREVFKR